MAEGNKDFAKYFNALLEEKEPRALQMQVAEKLGVAQGTLSKLRRGAMIPSDELAQRMISTWELNAEDFMDAIYKYRKESSAKTFREERRRMEEERAEVTQIQTKPRLPITAAAGKLSDYLDGVLASECEQIPVMRCIPSYDFTMIVKGDSMIPEFKSGDEIACRQVESVIEWGKPYVLATIDGAVLKRLYKTKEGLKCVSYNHTEYPDFEVKNEDILGVYKVVGLIRV